MPVKLTHVLQLSPLERLDKFRQSIPDGVGYTTEELVGRPEIGLGRSAIRDTMSRNKWAIKQWDDASAKMLNLLVNPKTLRKYAQKAG